MSEDKTVVHPVEIPGMQITFQSPLSPDGKGISFVIAADALLSLPVLNERLDIIAAAARRQAAFEELPIVKQSLHANRQLLQKAQDDRRKAAHTMEARLQAVRPGRRVPNQQAAPQDINAVAQHDQRILQIQGQIEGARARIPYLRAIIAGEEPPELYHDDETLAEAAE